MTVARRAGTFVYVSQCAGAVAGAAATIEEDEGTTSVVELDAARRLGLSWTFAAAWLTLEVHTSLESVGLTAVVAAALAEAGIAGNVLAGRYHDHLLVPVERVDEAIAVLEALRPPA